MRTFLTYVLAIAAVAVLATAPILVVGAVVYAEGAGHGGEFPSAAVWWSALGDIGPLAGVFALCLALIAAPAWMVWERAFPRLRARLGRASSLLGGPLVALAVGSAALVVRATAWFGDFKYNPIGETSFYLAVSAIAGAIWGTVFWLRAPKPTTAGIAA